MHCAIPLPSSPPHITGAGTRDLADFCLAHIPVCLARVPVPLCGYVTVCRVPVWLCTSSMHLKYILYIIVSPLAIFRWELVPAIHRWIAPHQIWETCHTLRSVVFKRGFDSTSTYYLWDFCQCSKFIRGLLGFTVGEPYNLASFEGYPSLNNLLCFY